MTTNISQEKILGPFLIIGTLLSLYLTINVGYDIFWEHTTWMHRNDLMPKIILICLYADFPLLFIAGLTSTISFFCGLHIWIPITKGIIVNILIWLLIALEIIIEILLFNLMSGICGLIIIGLCVWLIMRIGKMVR